MKPFDNFIADFKNAINTFFDGYTTREKSQPVHEAGNLLLKQRPDGRWEWGAVFSNKYRDNDIVPEILSSDAHRDYAEACKSGEWPMPELWHYHIKGTRWGVATAVVYDEDTGFIMAAGLVDEGHEKEAKALSDMDITLGVSHGMLRKETVRDISDPTVITRYRSIEISDLPLEVAANRLTGFVTHNSIKEGISMNDTQKAYLAQVGVDPGIIETLEQTAEDKARQAEQLNIESKTSEANEVQVEQVTDEPNTDESDDEQVGGEDKTNELKRSEVEEVLAEIGRYQKDVAEAVVTLTGAVAELSKRVSELEADDETKVAGFVENTPALSLSDIFHRSVIGNEATKVDGRTKLAKSGPHGADEHVLGFASPLDTLSVGGK